MPGTREVVAHQLRQIIVYTFYLGMFQCFCFRYELSPFWSLISFVMLLGMSIYEDTLMIDQLAMPESVMIVRIWSCNFPVIISNIIIYVLGRMYLMEVVPDTRSKIPGHPRHVEIKTAKSGVFVLDEIVLICAYYLYYFTAVAMFRSLINQYRYVKKLVEDNLEWTAELGDVPSEN